MNNTTYINKEMFCESNKEILKNSTFPIIITYEVVLGIFVLFLLFLKNYIFAGIFVLIIILFPIILKAICEKKIKQSSDMLFKSDEDNFIYNFVFNEDDFKLTVTYKGKSKDYNFKNNQVKKVIEKEDEIYIYIDRSLCYICQKSGFEKYDKLQFQSYFKGKAKKYEVVS